jgi:hypothetical protein
MKAQERNMWERGLITPCVWTLNENGNHICVDCETEVDPDETFGNREWSDPRCEDCYDTHKYRS